MVRGSIGGGVEVVTRGVRRVGEEEGRVPSRGCIKVRGLIRGSDKVCE